MTAGPSLQLYAKFGVPEVWIVDLLGAAIEVYREPVGDTYGRKERLTSGLLAPVFAPGVTIDVGTLLD
jgi:Uma2 family endonuclease